MYCEDVAVSRNLIGTFGWSGSALTNIRPSDLRDTMALLLLAAEQVVLLQKYPRLWCQFLTAAESRKLAPRVLQLDVFG